MVIHKKSDYDILVVTADESTARDLCLWDEIKERLKEKNFSAYVRIIPRDIDFVNYQLGNGQYFFTEICEQGIVLYDSGRFKLVEKKKLSPAEEKQIAQDSFDEPFTSAKEFYIDFDNAFKRESYKNAAFHLNQSAEFAYKTVLLVFGNECPREHHLDILGDLAADYCPELKGIIPRESEEERELFGLLDYAYIGARYDRGYKITQDQLQQLSPCVQSLLEVTERVCKKRIKEFVDE
jgi:HEPN domain-containing protein